MAHDVPVAWRQLLRNAALHDALRQALRPLQVPRISRDPVQLEKRACRTGRTVAEAQVVHVREIGKAVGNERRIAMHGGDVLQVGRALLGSVEISPVAGRPMEPREHVRHTRGAALEIGEVSILRQAGKRRKAAPAQPAPRLADGGFENVVAGPDRRDPICIVVKFLSGVEQVEDDAAVGGDSGSARPPYAGAGRFCALRDAVGGGSRGLAILLLARRLSGLVEDESRSRQPAVKRQVQARRRQRPVAGLVQQILPCRGETIGAAPGGVEIAGLAGGASQLNEKQPDPCPAAVDGARRRDGAQLLRMIRVRKPVCAMLILPFRALNPSRRTQSGAQKIRVRLKRGARARRGERVRQRQRGNCGRRERSGAQEAAPRNAETSMEA